MFTHAINEWHSLDDFCLKRPVLHKTISPQTCDLCRSVRLRETKIYMSSNDLEPSDLLGEDGPD